jgi:malate/lactate dehydrogenase
LGLFTGESRTDLIGRNQAILSSVIGDMKPIKETAILLLVANPVDVLTYFAHSYSGLPATQVIGSGTFLDSARLRGKLSGEVGVAASSIDAWVLGEHGESQIVSLNRKSGCRRNADLTAISGRLVKRLHRRHPTGPLPSGQIPRPRSHRHRDAPESFRAH